MKKFLFLLSLFMFFSMISFAFAVDLDEIVGQPKGDSERRDTQDYFICDPEGNAHYIDWGNWGEVGVWCDPDMLVDYYQEVEQRVSTRYSGLIIQSRSSPFSQRKEILSKLVSLITVMIHKILNERSIVWEQTEIEAFTKGVIAKALQESSLSQYKIIDNKIRLMRGDFGHGHGLSQIDDRFHFTALYEKSITWDLLHNMAYGIDFFLDKWLLIKEKIAQNQVSCISNDASDYYHSLCRSTYSLYNAGSFTKVCRWTNPDDRWYQNDENYESQYQLLTSSNLSRWDWRTNLTTAEQLVSDINIDNIFGDGVNPPIPEEPAPVIPDIAATSSHLQGASNCVIRATSDDGLEAICYPNQDAIYCENVVKALENFPDSTIISEEQIQINQISFRLGSETMICNEAFPPEIKYTINPGETIKLKYNRSRFEKPYDGQLLPSVPKSYVAVVIDRKFIDFNIENNYSVWYKIVYQGIDSWILGGTVGDGFNAYVELTDELPNDFTDLPQAGSSVLTMGENVQMTSFPGDGEVLTNIPDETEIDVLQLIIQSNTFNSAYLRILYNGGEGYIYIGPASGERVNIHPPEPDLPPAPDPEWHEKILLANEIITMDPYKNKVDQIFTFNAPDPNATSIRIHFNLFNVEKKYDAVYIMDQANNTVAMLDGNLGNDLWSPVVEGNLLKVHIKTDYSVTGSILADKISFFGITESNSTSTNIKEIAYPVSSQHNYPHSFDNIYKISHTGAKSIKIHFQQLETEQNYDFIYVYDKNNNQIEKYTGGPYTDLWTKVIPGDIVNIRLVSDYSISKYGFNIDLIEVEE
ncbi:secreted protein containing CUB domain protein [Candidatus Magnetomorum sp. HK-1]|nr:secreted protein containing CUB domain protein [Candidatus Magnetomorum sp. HK-1]